MAKVFQFFKECKAELKKVVWPSKQDVLSSIKVVIISTVIISVILGALDLGLSSGFKALVDLVNK